MSSNWVTLHVDGSPMEAYLSVPDTPGPHPGVVVGMHAFGVDRFIQGKCDDLAQAGFIAIAPYLYHRQRHVSLQTLIGLSFDDPRRRELAMPMKDALRDDEIRQDMTAALEYLRGLPSANGRYGVTGFCIGGRVAYLMAASTDMFLAAAIFYGTDIAQSWGHDGPSPLEMTGRIRCPIAGFFGNQDTNPSPEDVDRIQQALEQASVPYSFHRYDAPHAFNDPFNPVRWTPDAAADAWPRLLTFFGTHLGTGRTTVVEGASG